MLLDNAAEAVRPALRSFATTLIACSGATLVLAAASYLVAARGWVARGMLAALVAVALAVPVTALLAWRRAIAAGAVALAGRLGAAGRVARALFDRVGPTVTTVAEVERNLHEAARAHQPGDEGGALRRSIELRVVRAVERAIVGDLPRDGDGAIDVPRLRDDLAARAEARVAARIERALLGSTLLAAAAVAAAALAAAYALRVYS